MYLSCVAEGDAAVCSIHFKKSALFDRADEFGRQKINWLTSMFFMRLNISPHLLTKISETVCESNVTVCSVGLVMQTASVMNSQYMSDITAAPDVPDERDFTF